MSDALISPAVGATMWGATAVTAAYCARKVKEDLDEKIVPLMGVTGAFIFAGQMLNFTIPGTGSSGHLGGGLILAILLGPEAAFLVMASVLAVQALFFADGGLLALGANIFNMGFFSAFVAYPYVYRRIVRGGDSNARLTVASVAAAVVALELGAVAVVLQTTLSGVTELPFATFALAMLPIHLAIGVVEGLVTAAVVVFVKRAQPELLESSEGRQTRTTASRRVVVGLAVAAVAAAVALSWFASSNPDGLEWSIQRITGSSEIEGVSGSGAHDAAAEVQEKTALLPDYGFGDGADTEGSQRAGTSVSGLVGAALTVVVAVGIGLALRARRRRRAQPPR